jgi:hypothetical protein
MKKFSEFSNKKPIRRIYEQEEQTDNTNAMQNMMNPSGEETVKANLPENIDQPKEEGEIAGTTESNDVSTFFSKLFESREMAHVYHLQVRGDEGSYAKHMALGAYYEEVLEFIDDIIEIYQGQYGIVEGYDVIDTKDTKTKDPIAYFEEVADYIKHARKCISDEDTHLHNIVDELVALIYKTLYKLKFNK